MKSRSQIFTFFFLIITITLLGCRNEETAVLADLVTPSISVASLPAETDTNTPAPVSVDNDKSYLVYENEKDIGLSITDLQSGETRSLITAEELTDLLPKDLAPAYFGYEGLYAELSPDGTKLLASVCAEISSAYECLDKKFIINLLDKSTYPVEFSGNTISVISWSPDGQRIAFFTEAYERENIINANLLVLDTVTATPILYKQLGTGTEDYIVEIVWSPDSTFIYPIYYSSNTQKLKRINVETTEEQNVFVDGMDRFAQIVCMQFSPDGRKIGLMVSDGMEGTYFQIYTGNSDFTDLDVLAEFDSDHFGCSRFEWSPNSKNILVELSYIKNETYGDLDYNEFVFDVETGRQFGEVFDAPEGAAWFGPVVCGWSPNGDLLVTEFKEVIINSPDPTTETLFPTSEEMLELWSTTENYIPYDNSIFLLNVSDSSTLPFKVTVNCPRLWIPKEMTTQLETIFLSR